MGKNKKKREALNQKRAKKYVQRQSKQRIEPIPNELSASQLAERKLQLEPLVSEANMRIEMIQSAGYTSYALDRVIKEGDGRDYFDLENINTREDLLSEVTRMRIFLNDAGSTMKGARLETAQIYSEKYRGKFGNQYKTEENEFQSFDTSSIDPNVAKRAFANYRKIEEDRAALIGKQGMPGVYGSENLIIAIYDAEIRGKDSLVYGMELLDAFDAKTDPFIKEQEETADKINAITGLINFEMKGGRLF